MSKTQKTQIDSLSEILAYYNTPELPIQTKISPQEIQDAAKTKDYIVSGDNGEYKVSDVDNPEKKWTVKSGSECDCTQFEKQGECAHVRAVVKAATPRGVSRHGEVCAQCHHDSVHICKGHIKKWDYTCENCGTEGISKRRLPVHTCTYDGPIFG